MAVPSSRRASRGSSGSDACIVGPGQLEGASFSQHRPGDAGKLVGERDRQHVVVQPPLGGIDPGFEPVTFPVLYPDQPNPRRLTGFIAAALAAWSFLVWSILQVFVGASCPARSNIMSYIAH